MEFFFAILDTPMASVAANAAGSPSGIAPTASAIAALNISSQLSPLKTPTANVTTARAPIMYINCLLNPAIFLIRGVSILTVSLSKSEILPTSVFVPVDTTIP